MSKYRTAMGKTVDMSTLASKNENVRAVGNMKVNARGDSIDIHGKVITPVTAKVNTAYSQTVGNKSAQPRPNRTPAPKSNLDLDQLSASEIELEESLSDDIEVEKIKAKSIGK
ncbi:MAG: hypothetical protein ACOVLB_01230 [Candidatus Nanopelagicus sp.]|jgi:hypothetical protein